MEEVILVTEKDEPIGTMEKMEAHRKGALHRAFSIFVLNDKGQMLLQQRALTKYHSGGLWTNACCSHPRPNESTEDAATRRLHEELGFTTGLKKIFKFQYHSKFPDGLIEHELDYVYLAYYNGAIYPAPEEVMDYTYMELEKINSTIKSSPAKFTTWFQIAFPKVLEWLNENNA